VTTYEPKSKGAEAYIALAREFIGKEQAFQHGMAQTEDAEARSTTK
jgi:hypothetical protein